MSWGVPSMANQFRQMTAGKSSVWADFAAAKGTTNGFMDTRALSGLVTDSAAASSAWGSGRHVWNGMLNAYPGGVELTPILHLMRDRARMRTGLVSTATITHATPAGWAVSFGGRDNERGIAEKYLTTGIDVFLGGGDRFFAGNDQQSDLYEAFAKANYSVVKDRLALARVHHGKVLGVFSPGHLPFDIDRVHQPELEARVPSLAEMTRKAIELLDVSGDGFILQVEGGRIDHAAHSNDAAGLIYDQLAFEDALAVVIEFAREDGETLVVVTSDHGNSNPGLVGSSADYNASNAGLRRLESARGSNDVVLPRLAAAKTKNDIQFAIENVLGIQINEAEAGIVLEAAQKNSKLGAVDQYSTTASALALVLGNHTHIGWSGRQHTSDVTKVSAMGPGADAFAGPINNVDVFGKLLAHRGIKFENPIMTYEEAAARLSAKAQNELMIAQDDHWI